MKTKFLDLDKIYDLHFNDKIVIPKHLPLQVFVIATLKNSFGIDKSIAKTVKEMPLKVNFRLEADMI